MNGFLHLIEIMCCCFLSKKKKQKKKKSSAAIAAAPRAPPAPPAPPTPSRHRHRRPPSSRSSSSSLSSSSITATSSSSSLPSLIGILPSGPIPYQFSEISIATDHFAPSKKLSPSVWKASLRGSLVAISRHPRSSLPSRLLSRFLRRLHSLHHSSIAKILGASLHGEYLFLVYEFVEGSNLADCLRNRLAVDYTPLSSWRSRLQIAIDVAKGLEYLHHHCSPTIVHKYMDSRNVLVGNDLRAKIAHVGVAALMGEIDILRSAGKAAEEEKEKERGATEEEDSGEIREEGAGKMGQRRREDSMNTAGDEKGTVRINGIQGYMPPEYLAGGVVSAKYDVYAYGVILAELMSGAEGGRRRTAEGGRRKETAAEALEAAMTGENPKGGLRMWMDGRLKDSYPVEDVERVAKMARECMNRAADRRPDMSEVASELQKCLASAKKWEEEREDGRREITASTLRPR